MAPLVSSLRGRGLVAEAPLEIGGKGCRRTIICQQPPCTYTRRNFLLRSSSAALLLALFPFSGTRPSYLGVQQNPPSLALCPPTPNCISTSENDPSHFVPPWTYNPEDGRGKKKPVTRDQAMKELLDVIKSTKPDNFTPKIVEQREDYIYVEYQSPIFGFVDDVEFWFAPGDKALVEYRSASRFGKTDFDINRKRIRIPTYASADVRNLERGKYYLTSQSGA